uniref:AlNc14C139G7187 protein n=1 Tax=Albugo laibachii Nc14 TaxID=890382 RepID=F0WKZ7_9STRA|nr:AlNc14C139G7187 [Albugo laibachii Nc14]|eukprot:CCA21956.1 AlNc14C139G7187 [Albugo laibachii Nc14]
MEIWIDAIQFAPRFENRVSNIRMVNAKFLRYLMEVRRSICWNKQDNQRKIKGRGKQEESLYPPGMQL